MMSAMTSCDQNEVIICKSALSDSFLLYLIKESSKAENVKPYEHQYLTQKKVKFYSSSKSPEKSFLTSTNNGNLNRNLN